MMESKTKTYRAKYWVKWRLENKPYKEKVCIVCIKPFQAKSGRQMICHICLLKTCEYCGKKFLPKESQRKQKYCTLECYAKYREGNYPKNFHNKRGVKPRTALKNSARLKHGAVEDIEWRNKVFKRDNWTCKKCGKVGGKLEAHHIKPFKKYPELRFDLNNGATLCKDPCHKETDSYGWKNYWKNYK